MYFLLVLIPLGMLTPGFCPRLLLESQDWVSINHTQLTLHPTCSLQSECFIMTLLIALHRPGLLRVCPGQTAWCHRDNVTPSANQRPVIGSRDLL